MFCATAKVLREVELLVDQHDAQRHRRRASSRTADGPPSTRSVAAGPRLDAGQDLDERRLAGAVLAEQAVDAAGFERETHAMQHLHRAEGFH